MHGSLQRLSTAATRARVAKLSHGKNTTAACQRIGRYGGDFCLHSFVLCSILPFHNNSDETDAE